MNLQKIKSFLNEKPGYLKEGAKRLCKKLKLEENYENFDLCKKAIREVYKERSKFNYRKKSKKLIYDLETSYNIGGFWKSGYNITVTEDMIIHERAIITASWKWYGEDKIHYMSWENGCDKKIVEKLIELFFEADEIIGHNVDRYDNAFLMTRAMFHGILALPKYKTFDTYKKASSFLNLNSKKLDYLAKVLGIPGKYKHSGLSMWHKIIHFDVLNIGSKELRDSALEEMIYYNCVDVGLTEAVYEKLRLYAPHNVHHGVLMGKTKYSCPHCGSENVEYLKTTVTAAGTLKHIMKCMDCGQVFFISNSDFLKMLKK